MTVLPFQLDGTTGNIKSRLYDPEKDAFLAHVAGGNNHNHHHHHQQYHQITIFIAGWNDRVEYDGDGEELEENRRVVTIARFHFL